jgi:hypothetical protein
MLLAFVWVWNMENVGYEVLTTVTMKRTIFLVIGRQLSVSEGYIASILRAEE